MATIHNDVHEDINEQYTFIPSGDDGNEEE